MLYDVSVEVRMSSVLYHTMSWDSFVRVVYGFNEIRGFGDVDGDMILDSSDNTLNSELSNETSYGYSSVPRLRYWMVIRLDSSRLPIRLSKGNRNFHNTVDSFVDFGNGMWTE